MEQFKKIEEEILDFWEENDVFAKSLERRKKSKRFVFFEGPPTANGRPGIHHFIGRAFKDLFCRYKTMRGFYVERKSGWDTHGLPVEIEVEKQLGLKSKKEIEEYGIAKFNQEAKKNVWKYKEEWERFTERIGFWLDLKHPYVTYEPKYIESVWRILKKIWDKKLLYKGHKVVPFCTRCGTPLSSHEVAQGYKTITDKSVIVRFRIKNQELRIKNNPNSKFQVLSSKFYFLAWTTTPWTLPGNVALAVGANIKYQVVSIMGKDEKYILAKDLAEKILDTEYEILDTVLGKELVGLEYEPLFDVEKLKSDKSYRVYAADFVNTQEGTGIVHTAVMYGDDDYNLGTKLGLPKFHTVDERGKFTGVGYGLDGLYVKDSETEKLLIRELEIRNLLFKIEDFEHDYPFCWRCEQPLIYYATDSWFIGMSKLGKKLLKNNQKVNWHPAHLKEGRFGEWLRGVKDWAISRERYWGTPLPIWACIPNGNFQFPISNFQKNQKSGTLGCGHCQVVGSLAELEKYRYRGKNTYFLMRHGHSAKNGLEGEEGAIIASKLDKDKYDLTPDGRKTVAEQAEVLKKMGGADVIVSSPFLRTKQTAEMVAEKLGLKYQIDERLKELDHGSVCEDKLQISCPMELGGRTMENAQHGDGETWREARRRMWSALSDLDRKYENKKIVIVGHGDPLWLLESAMLGLDDEETTAYRERVYPVQGKFRKVDLKNLPHNENGDLDLHRPYIDEISLKCRTRLPDGQECGGEMKRVKDVVDVWFDSGAMPYAQWHYPFENKDRIDPPTLKLPPTLKFWRTSRRTSASPRNFPADFISEGIDQTRGWFYTLLAISTLLDKGPAYKNVLSYGHVLDEKGQKMSKSKGNIVDPWAVIENYGADAARWYFYTVNEPGEHKLFSLDDVALRFRGFIMTLWNSFRFFELYKVIHNEGLTFVMDNFHKKKPENKLDQWILSRLNSVIKIATQSLDNFDPTTASRAIEQFVVEYFSKWWLRRSRSRFQKPQSENELVEALSFLRFLLLEIAKIIAPFTPFTAEKIHQELHKNSEAVTKSVHWHNFPSYQPSAINYQLEQEMEEARKIVTAGLAQRKEKQLKVRQPLAHIAVKRAKSFDPELEMLIKDELNVKEIIYGYTQKEEVLLDDHLTQELVWEGWARELVRQIQDMRKEAGYKFDDRVFAQWHSGDEELKKALGQWSDFIKQNSLLKEFSEAQHTDPVKLHHGAGQHFDIQKEFELAPQKKIWTGVRK